MPLDPGVESVGGSEGLAGPQPRNGAVSHLSRDVGGPPHPPLSRVEVKDLGVGMEGLPRTPTLPVSGVPQTKTRRGF